MDIFSLITSMESDRISSEKLEALKQALMQQLEQFDHVTHSPDGIKEARQNRAELNKLRRSIEEQRKEIRRNCFDTYRYAKQLKEAMGWENVKLEYLARQFGVSQPDAHRAWCDAEANVGVYFRLKEIIRLRRTCEVKYYEKIT